MNTEQRHRRRVTRAIKLALARIAEKNPELARLLKETIETGTYLSYSPAPQVSPRRKLRHGKENAASPGKEQSPTRRR